MNKLPEGTKVRVPMTLVYLPAGKPMAVANWERLPVTAADYEDAKEVLQLLMPGARVVAVEHGHKV